MKTVRLSFCEIIHLATDMVEVITFEGVEVNDDMVAEYHDFFETNMKVPFGILVNKKNAFSYGFSAMRKIGKVALLRAVAVLHYSILSENMQALINQSRPNDPLNMKHFFERDKALAWLRQEL